MGLLHTGGTKDSAQFTQLVGAVASEMTARHKDQFHQHFHQPLLRPLYHCLQSHGSGMEGKVVVSEEDLTRCLEDMHKVEILLVPQCGLCYLHDYCYLSYIQCVCVCVCVQVYVGVDGVCRCM